MPRKSEVIVEANTALRRREFFARYPDAILLKSWILDKASELGITPGGVKSRINRGQLQLRTHKLTSHEVYVIP
jgi:hypothetical protein